MYIANNSPVYGQKKWKQTAMLELKLKRILSIGKDPTLWKRLK